MLKQVVHMVSTDSTHSFLLSFLKSWWTKSVMGLENYWPSTNTEHQVNSGWRENPVHQTKQLVTVTQEYKSPRGESLWPHPIQPAHGQRRWRQLKEFHQLWPTHFKWRQEEIKSASWLILLKQERGSIHQIICLMWTIMGDHQYCCLNAGRLLPHWIKKPKYYCTRNLLSVSKHSLWKPA